ncbi:MAG: hypothetical protein J7L82_05750 [Staphylothermus sp.]|nr:hypothetical protein [Staphylothermus sp.]
METTHLVSRLVEDLKIISELDDGLPLFGLLLALLFSTLWPLDLVVLLVLGVYLYYRAGIAPLTHSIVIVYALLSFTNHYLVGFVLLSLYLTVSMIYSRKYLLLVGSVFLYTITFMVLGSTHYIASYYSVLVMYLSGKGHEALGIHLVLLQVLALYTILHIPLFRASRIGGYFIENPGAYPVIQFMLLLIYAAILLVMGNEYLANKVAELAYYSLVLGVILSLKQVVSEKEAEEKEEKPAN